MKALTAVAGAIVCLVLLGCQHKVVYVEPGSNEGVASVKTLDIAVAGICGAMQFIPLWAREIARLPERPPRQGPSRGGPRTL